MTGEIHGGPVFGEPGGELYCTLQVNNNMHSGPDTVVRSSGPADSTGISVVVAADVAYLAPDDAQDYVCTSYRRADGTWLYWHPTVVMDPGDPSDDEAGHWTTDSNKPCSPSVQFWPPAHPVTACLAVSDDSSGPDSEAICAGVDGVTIDPDTGEILAGRATLASVLGISSHDSTVIGIEYDKANFRSGSSFVVVTNNPQGCRNGAAYRISALSGYWNDRISSAQSFAGCWSDHREHANLGGSLLTCTCSSMGVMNNATSSIRWRR